VKILGLGVPIFTSDFEAAITRYEALTGETVEERFELADRGIRIAILGSLTIIAGTEQGIGALRGVRANDTVTHDTTLGVHVADLPTTRLRHGDRVDFTFNWPEVDRWEGTDFLVCVE
jgi:hypothetical protein